MNLISIISFLICFVLIAISLKRNSDILSPGRVFVFTWALVIGVTNLKLSRFQFIWPFEVWSQILIGPISFLSGVFIVYVINFGKKVYNSNGLKLSEHYGAKIDGYKLKNIAIFLFILFIIGYFVILIKAGNIPLLANKPWIVRRNFTMFGLGLFLHHVYLIVVLTGIYFVVENHGRKNKYILFSISIISVILYAVTLQRYQIMFTIFSMLILLYYKTNKINIKSIFFISLIIIGFFYFVSTFRLGELVLVILYKISRMKYSMDYAIFTEPYMYIAMNLENFAHSILKITNFSFGYYTFDFLGAITGLKHWISEYFNFVQNPMLLSNSYNTQTAFWTYYRDFGILGIFFFPFLGGVLISNLYYSFKKDPTYSKLTFYGMFLYVTIFSFFNSTISFLWFFYDFIVLMIIFKYIESKTIIH